MNAKFIQYIGLIALLKVIREISTGGVLSHRKSGSLFGDFIPGVYHRGGFVLHSFPTLKTLDRLISLQLPPILNNLDSMHLTSLAIELISNHSVHSTETSLLSLLSGIYSAADKSQLALFALFDIIFCSLSWHIVDHEILLQQLETCCGLKCPLCCTSSIVYIRLIAPI